MTTSHHWGIVLAGGNGFRLRDHGQTAWGDNRPKQFCPLLHDNRNLLEETRQLAESSVPPEQILYSVTQGHEQYYRASLGDRVSQTVVQPSNKGTAPAILAALIHIVQGDPNAIVALLPCEHSYSPANAFIVALESAFEISEQRSCSVVLLGLDPKGPEVDCGWIETGETIGGHPGLAEVKSLREKPSQPLAQKLLGAGSLWNSSAMVAHVCTFLELAWAAVPGLLQALESREVEPLPGGEVRIPTAVYERIVPTDFSRQVLSSATERLLSLRVSNVEWSDLEEETYRDLVINLQKTGELPSWARLWPTPTTHVPTANA